MFLCPTKKLVESGLLVFEMSYLAVRERVTGLHRADTSGEACLGDGNTDTLKMMRHNCRNKNDGNRQVLHHLFFCLILARIDPALSTVQALENKNASGQILFYGIDNGLTWPPHASLAKPITP